jgi:very-short-patch-repair endonuclease
MAKPGIIKKARYLRREETKAEKILWEALRNNNFSVKWRRQHPVDMFIIDFYAPKIKLAIELDGSTHNLKGNKEYDQDRTNYLNSKYITVLRFWNSEVENNLAIVLDKIQKAIKKF